MGYLTATASGSAVLPLVVRDATGALYSPTDARYQLRDSTRTVIRAFPPSGTDFTALATGVLETTITAPATPGEYVVEYEATVNGTLYEGEADVLVVASATAGQPLRTGT